MARSVLLILFLVVGNFTWAQELEEVLHFGPDPGKLRMFVHVPQQLERASEPLPLVVALHGCSQDAEELVTLSGWVKLADERGFILLCPEQRGANNVSHCFNWFRSKDAYGDQGEARSIVSMIDFAKKHWQVDTQRVFIYGVSAGAAMAVNLMVGLPATFNMGASLAGGPCLGAVNALKAMRSMLGPQDLTPEAWKAVVSNTFPNNTGPWPKLIVMHGTKDGVVDPRSSLELIDQWAGLHGTDAIPDKEERPMEGHNGIERCVYNDPNDNAVITYYSIANMGHAIPIDPGPGPCQGGRVATRAVDLDFHSTCVIADGFGL